MTVADQSVHVLPFQSGICNGVGAGFQVKAECGPVRNDPLGGVANADNGVLVFQTHRCLLLFLSFQ